MEKQLKKWKTATVIVAVIAIALAAVLSQSMFASPKKAADKAIDYINKNLLQNGSTAKLNKIDNEKMDLQKIMIDVGGQEFASYISMDGKYLFVQEPYDMNKTPETGSNPEMQQKEATDVEGGFKEIKDVEVCKETDKPVVYFFGSTTCPHCLWEKPIIKSVIDQFGSAVSYHENIDTDKDQDVFTKYSPGSVPTLVVGCKYYRVGSGESSGEDAEKEALTKVICRATGNLPASICQ